MARGRETPDRASRVSEATREEAMKILKQLSEAMGVSGDEKEVRRAILDLVRPHADDIQTDPLGNLLVTKRARAAAA